jgi:hypothetical protein
MGSSFADSGYDSFWSWKLIMQKVIFLCFGHLCSSALGNKGAEEEEP